MATSGWQNEQTWFTYSSNIHLVGNIRIDGITHSGTNLRVWGAIAGGARGNSNYRFYYSDYTSYAQPEGGGKIALGGKGKTWRVGDADTVVGFDVTLTGVSADTTTRSFFVNFYGPNTNSVVATLRWTLYFDASGSAPSGGYIVRNSQTWNSVNATSSISSWNNNTGRIEAILLVGSNESDFPNINSGNWTSKGRLVWQSNTSALSATFNMTATNYNLSLDSPLAVKGMRKYYLVNYAVNSFGTNRGWCDWVVKYLPPSPPKITYTTPATVGTKVFPVEFTGEASNNATTYDTGNLTRTVRYKVGSGDWVYVKNDEQALIDAVTSFNVSVPAQSSAVIEGWMTYHGEKSETKTTNLYNGNQPSNVYGSVDGKSKLIQKFYGSVDGQSVEIVKLYGSVDGESVKLLG